MKIKRFQGGYDKNFCYVVSCDETRMAAIIDPAVEINPVIEYIESEDLILDKILVTHTHHDHIYYLNDFIDLYPLAKVYAASNAAFKTIIEFKKVEHNEISPNRSFFYKIKELLRIVSYMRGYIKYHEN